LAEKSLPWRGVKRHGVVLESPVWLIKLAVL